MSDGDFSTYISRERERLNADREAVFTQQEALQKQLDEINREFGAIEAYEAAKTGKAARGGSSFAGTGRGGRQSARRGSKREALLEVIRQGAGLARREILDRMGLRGEKSGEMSVSNALTALTKSNQVRRDGGKYHLA